MPKFLLQMLPASRLGVRVVSLTVLVMTLFFGISSDNATANSHTAPMIIDQQIEIDYGEKISVTASIGTGELNLDAKSSESVRALFRPRGGSTIWSYLYPEFSLAHGATSGAIGDQLSVEFEIPTGPGSYYPPGVEFDIEFELTNVGGDSIRLPSPEAVEYLDPARDWQRVPGDGYTVIYYGVSRDRVDELIEAIDFRISTIEATTGVTDPPDLKAIVFPTIQDATPSFPPVSQTAKDQRIFAGFAKPQYRLFVQGRMNTSTFAHELAHLYTHEAISSAFESGIPSWLDEGIARFLENGSSEPSNERLRATVDPNELLSLTHMNTIPGKSRDVAIFYPQVGAFVGYLVEKHSHAHIADLLGLINRGRELEDAFEIVFDAPLSEVENDWRKLFGAPALALASATPETGGTVYDTANTPVPLIDYDSLNTGDVNTGAVEQQNVAPTATTISQSQDSSSGIASSGNSDPNWAVAAVIIGLSTITGVWLFTSRRRMPKRKS
ncbi:MAG: hypothetical protein CL784_07675 [Chloroflexi bacterium]|nr:hypothetical protein [Chloroflexota bacterium]|tara:strand:+ start:1237 stop:2727 length:1491 start_codon:yes stop_codon:yes gene_type:complete